MYKFGIDALKNQHATQWSPHPFRLQEKEKWEEEVYRSFDSATGDLLESERPGDLPWGIQRCQQMTMGEVWWRWHILKHII